MCYNTPMVLGAAKKSCFGFTLVELMIVLSIIGILTSLAYPYYSLVQARSRRAEVYSGLSGIYKVEIAYFSTDNAWLDQSCPPGPPYCTCAAGPFQQWSHNFTTPGFNLSNPAKTYGFCIDIGIPVAGFTARAAGNIDNDLTYDWAEVNNNTSDPIYVIDDVLN